MVVESSVRQVRGSAEILVLGPQPRLVSVAFDYDAAVPLTDQRLAETYAEGGPKLPFLEGVYAVGRNPIAAIEALGQRIGWGPLSEFEALDVESSDAFDGWYYRFLADGTSMKAAGRAVPGGVVLTWWK